MASDWVTARDDDEGDCRCGAMIVAGMDVRPDEQGGWLCESCGEK